MANPIPAQYAGSRTARETDLPSYISGYVDGEGCFTVSISPRRTLRVGWEVRPSLSVSQNGDRSEVLLEIQQYFGCGMLRPDRSDQTVKWEARSLLELRLLVVPHFHSYPLRSGKHRDFELFADICERMARGQHLVPAGLIEIVRLASQMNPSGKRAYRPDAIIASLRIRDEGIVCPVGNNG
ncbi:MAG: endonuclease [Acidimicrobiia bacterium]|nr:endonuclease [Acidimicrobiia bacterium]